MKLKIVTLILAIVIASTLSCTDESLYPLPYNDRTTGAYLRIYKQTSNVLDLNNLAASAFEAIFEPVDENNGNDLERIDFFVSHRRGTDLTPEVFVKSVNADIFQPVPQPTYSVYKRGTVRLTATEALTALQTITTDPDGDGVTPPICTACVPLKGLAAFAGPLQLGDQLNIRYEMVMKDGRKFSVANPQTTVNPAFANSATANSTPNITTGQFYNSPFVVIMTVRSLIPGSWLGTYTLRQRAIWSPAHNLALHQSAWPSYLSEVLFPEQTVTLSVPSNGLSTQRQFNVTYKGQTVSMVINFERTRPGLNGATTGQAAINNSLIPWGFPAGTTDETAASSNLGSIFVPIINTGVDCTSTRELYWTTPQTGQFGNGSSATNPTASNQLSLHPLLPQNRIPNQGVYRIDIDGLAPGDTFSIALDDDADEYGRRNGYCTWTRRVYLTLTKL